MITIIKNVEVYSPKNEGIKDIVLFNDKIEGLFDNFNFPENFFETKIIDGTGMIAVPGFIDSHVHIIGGGGEGGFKTRTPELPLSELIKAGITTVVGCIGTDGICRDMKGLIAKAKALDEEGITAYCYTGSYDVPVKTVTESIKSDIILLDKVIGVGEIALSDHRSSQATYEHFVNIVAQSRVGGLLSSKAGIVNVHLGDGARKMEYLFKVIETTEIPPTQLLPTHVNRSTKLFDMGCEYVKKGGIVDFTTSSNPEFLEEDELRASEALKMILDRGGNIQNITFSSDGNGSMPVFNSERELVGLSICSVASLFSEVREAVLNMGVPFETALKVITSNVAKILNLYSKGSIEKNKDADIVLLHKESLEINTVLAKGRVLMEQKKLLVKGTFEK